VSDSSIINGIQHLKRSIAYWEVFAGSCGSKYSKRLINGYISKFKWVLNDLLSEGLGEDVKTVLKAEYKSDVLEVDEIADKFALLPVNQREFVINMIDLILSGEELKIMDDGK
jgi:hypothetical protein